MTSRPWTTALVTGASSGLGAALARRLLADGVGVVAVARDRTRLEALADSGATADVEVLTADLTTRAGQAAVADRIDDDSRPVDLAVANAGVWGFGDIADADPEAVRATIELDVTAVVDMTRVAAAAMRRRGSGSIVLISSIAGDQPLAHESVYGGCKAFVTSFGQAVACEMRGSGVTVTTVLPGLVRTELHERVPDGTSHVAVLPDGAWMDADVVAGSILDAAARGRTVHVPGTMNRIVSNLTDVTPRALTRRAAAFVNRRRR